ncbi:MAG: hypothetical protein ACKPKO_18560, partial [Candidatus Fonsibacter sp.]
MHSEIQSTTAGGAESCGSDNDDLETYRSDSTRMRASRSSATKSKGRKQKRLQRFLEYNRAKALVAGETFEVVIMEERRSQQRVSML